MFATIWRCCLSSLLDLGVERVLGLVFRDQALWVLGFRFWGFGVLGGVEVLGVQGFRDLRFHRIDSYGPADRTLKYPSNRKGSERVCPT